MRLWQRILDLINPPAYPEYAEYKDQEEGEVIAPADDAALKVRRLKIVAVFSVVLSLAGGAWLYSQGELFVEKQKPEIDPVLATEMLKEMAPEREKESLDDVKRWAQQLEANVVRDAKDTRTAGRGAFVDRTVPYTSYEPYIPPEREEPVAQVSEPETRVVAVTPEPGPTAYPAVPRTAPPERPATDTPTGRYQPRRYDPIIIEPRTVDPY